MTKLVITTFGEKEEGITFTTRQVLFSALFIAYSPNVHNNLMGQALFRDTPI